MSAERAAAACAAGACARQRALRRLEKRVASDSTGSRCSDLRFAEMDQSDQKLLMPDVYSNTPGVKPWLHADGNGTKGPPPPPVFDSSPMASNP